MYQASADLLDEQVDDELVDRRVFQRLAALAAKEDGDGHAPDALTRDAPVGTGGDHVGNAFLAPGGVPGDSLDFFEGSLAEGGDGRGCWWRFGGNTGVLRFAQNDNI